MENKRKAFFKKATTTTTPKPLVKRVVRVYKRKTPVDVVTSATEVKAVEVKADKVGRKLLGIAETSQDKEVNDDKVGRKLFGLAETSQDKEDDVEEVRLSKKERRQRRREEKERRARLEEEQESRTEFFVHPDDLYPAKTERLYDPVLKVSLPAFMVERSEHEEIFDEVLAAGI